MTATDPSAPEPSTPNRGEAACKLCVFMAGIGQEHRHRHELATQLRHEIRNCDTARAGIAEWAATQYEALEFHDAIMSAEQQRIWAQRTHKNWHQVHAHTPDQCGLRERVNVHKTRCRWTECTAWATVLVSDGFCATLLCPAHERKAVASLRYRGYASRITVTPAAQCWRTSEDYEAHYQDSSTF
ncbi:hypothetical protein AB0L82_36000 [Nocardia sp. NPDC052001]|uniref:hypothetical protein n=1 Tax=Nocardia sp. NPDC052001 TaxID=3154853 RepID=UPI0034465D0B